MLRHHGSPKSQIRGLPSRAVAEGARYEIVRTRNFLDHRHDQVAQIDTEITIRCGGSAIDNIVLRSADFLPGLRVVDSSGEEYPLLSNEDVRSILKFGTATDPPGLGHADILDAIDRRQIRLLWIKVPPHKRLQPNEVRIIHLKYDHSKGGGGSLSVARRWLGGSILIDVPSQLPFPVFWILRKPVDYDIVRRGYSKIEDGVQRPMGSWKDNSGAIFCNDAENTVHLSVDRRQSGAVLSYTLRPKWHVLALPVAAVVLLSLLPVALGLAPLVAASGTPIGLAVGELSRHELPLLLFVLAASMVVPRFIDDVYIRNGLLPLYVVPVALALYHFVF